MTSHRNIPADMIESQWIAAIQVAPKRILSSNSKLSKDGIHNVTLPALRSKIVRNGVLTDITTCPSAGACKSYCYASGGTYNFSNCMIKHARNLQYMISDPFSFVAQLVKEIRSIKNLRAIRWNDSGDFYGLEYWNVAKAVMAQCPDIKFYAYSKRVSFFKSETLPVNFTLVYSFGGTEDAQIDLANDRHAKVFANRKSLRAAGYSDGTNTDRMAANANFKKIGLIVHGNHKAMPRFRRIIAKINAKVNQEVAA
jgi:hypothetical protein